MELQRLRPVKARNVNPSVDVDQARRELLVAQRLLKAKDAQTGLIPFTEFTMPHPDAPDDAERSRYEAQYFHKALAAALEEVYDKKIQKLIITFPPRHGKSELTSRRMPAYILGRDPYAHVMMATYNQPFAEDFGREVREIMQSPSYKQVFPRTTLRKGSQASDRLQTKQGGKVSFVGRGGSITGRGADYLIIDDPIKNSEEAQSDTIRELCWTWFNRDVMSRMMTDAGCVIIIMTRWHEDDLVGRLTDPENPCFNEREASQWKIINIPALAEDNDILGRQPGQALWPQRFNVKYLEDYKARDPEGFSALYQQRPSPLEGAFFKKGMIVPYERNEIPNRLRVYAASDHAVTSKQSNDRTCVLFGGLDEDDVLWLLPDIFWDYQETDVVVEHGLSLMNQYKPLTWWAESGHITKSIGPFLRRRMRERGIYVNIQESPAIADKEQRAQPIRARMSMGMVRFPKWAWWYADAVSELLKFPNGRLNDFADALAHLGMGLDSMVGVRKYRAQVNKYNEPGTIGWIKQAANAEKRRKKRRLRLGGM